MRNCTLTKMLIAAVLPLASSNVLQAQIFEKQNTSFFGLHRGSPLIGDYNNDGKADIYYGGEHWGNYAFPSGTEVNDNNPLPDGETLTGAWQVQGVLYSSNGEGYTASISNLYDETGAFNAMGLPPSVYSYGRFIDLDNDGNLDFIICGRGDNDLGNALDGTNPHRAYFWAYRNTGIAGGYKFEKVEGLPFIQSDNDGRDGSAKNNNSISFGDYNNDGLIDVVYQGVASYYEGDEEKSRRFVELYKNLGDFKFELANVANPIPYEENYNTDYLFDVDETSFEATPNYKFRPLSNSAIQFGDFNGDGYLDLIYTGWEDNTGASIVMYKNNGDGTFDELPLSRVDSPVDGRDFIGLQDGSDMAVADINNDGWLDIIVTGTPNGDNPAKRCDIYFNRGTGDFTFDRSSVEEGNGLYGASASILKVVDINNDGRNDVMLQGWSSNVSDWGGQWIFFQNMDNTFTLQDNGGMPRSDSGGYALYDINGNGALDAFWTGYDNGCTSTIYLNSYNENTIPTAPADVKASFNEETGKVTVTWAPGSDDETDVLGLAYNVYAQDNENGKIYAIIPADLTTGRVKTVCDMQTLVHSANETEISYSLALPTDREYTIGVSTLDPSFASSSFATTTIQNTTSVTEVKAEAAVMTVTENGVVVNGPTNASVQVYNLAGHIVATGISGKEIKLATQGVYIVKCNELTGKLIK